MSNYNTNRNRITTNGLLNPTKRVIKNYGGKFTVSDGPNITSFLDLSDIAIPNDSHYTSRIVLPAYTTDYFLNYSNFNNITTFLLIKVTYNGNYDNDVDGFDPYYYHEPNNYNIEYYYDGNSGHTYPINRLLVLNGSFTNKIGQIYLNNPLGYDVALDVFHANISVPTQKPIPPSSASTISNLYYSDIFLNQVICTNSGITRTGSTAFIINEYIQNLTGYTIQQHIIPYDTIISVKKDTYNIYIDTTTVYYTLKFLTDFYCDQAYIILFEYNTYIDYCTSCFSDGFWQDKKVWLDFKIWIDYPII